MKDFEEIRDPILRIFAIELWEKLEAVSFSAIHAFYSAKKSLQSKQGVPRPTREEAYQRYFDAENSQRAITFFVEGDAYTQIARMKDTHFILTQATEYFQSSRRFFQRYTSVDSALSLLRYELTKLLDDINLLSEAIATEIETDAKKKIYDRVLGEKLNQLDAPYLFKIANYIIDLLPPPSPQHTDNSSEALALLTKEAADLAKSLIPTNIDRRFLTALQDYIGALLEKDFSPIKVDLFSNKLRAYLIEFKDELPGFAVAEISALLLSQEQVLRQFPSWRSFEEEASRHTPSEESQNAHERILEEIATQTRTAEGVASERVLEAIERLEGSADTQSRITTNFGVWRSVENFIKTNIKQIIDVAKNWKTDGSKSEQRYLKYLERLIPHLKFYVTMNEKYIWLLPVIRWLEEFLKTLK